MIRVIDSWRQPTSAQIAAAKAAGYGAWMGYFKQTATDNIYAGWSDATFALVKAGGLLTGAYCSQLDDPTWVRNRAASLGIPAILDCESGIVPDNAGTDGWLATAGAHLYGISGTQSNHRTHGHAGYIFAEYPTAGNPNGLNWPAGSLRPSPARPMGWQYSDKGSVGGWAVDLSIFDPAIFGSPTPVPKEDEMLMIFTAAGVGGNAEFISNGMFFRLISSPGQLADIENVVGPIFNGAAVPIYAGGAVVADVGAFGVPADEATASALGLPFPGATGPAGPAGPPGTIPATAKVTGTVTLS